ncbi:MAG TPA: transposase [Gaiellaceae bacterium]|nr:transposase [Gaiellaceae bacterium]
MDTALAHVTNRGNNRAPIYRDSVDYLTFLRMLADVVAVRGWTRHAYCLMPNHYHLLIECPETDLARGMHLLNGRYARRFNQRHGRTGHLFQGPYDVESVTRDEHLLEACRYIVLNPVRAGLCALPSEWPWSSYHEEQTPLVTEMIGDRAAYEAFVLAGLAERLQPA